MSETLPSPNGPSAPSGPAGPGGPSRDGGATGLLERVEQTQEVEPGDHERFSHYVRKEKILASAVSGNPVIALCGKVWIPGRDPNRFPVCPVCKEIYEGFRKPEDGDGNDGAGDSDK